MLAIHGMNSRCLARVIGSVALFRDCGASALQTAVSTPVEPERRQLDELSGLSAR
jgi:hypothetical protein